MPELLVLYTAEKAEKSQGSATSKHQVAASHKVHRSPETTGQLSTECTANL